MVTENQQTKNLCSSDRLVTITGLELCAELTYPNASLKSDAPYFPLTGPVTAGIFLYNRDTHKKYKMEARSLHVRILKHLKILFYDINKDLEFYIYSCIFYTVETIKDLEFYIYSCIFYTVEENNHRI